DVTVEAPLVEEELVAQARATARLHRDAQVQVVATLLLQQALHLGGSKVRQVDLVGAGAESNRYRTRARRRARARRVVVVTAAAACVAHEDLQSQKHRLAIGASLSQGWLFPLVLRMRGADSHRKLKDPGSEPRTEGLC